MAQIVIIGAGLTGLSAAYHLEKMGFHDYLIFEKESSVGGLCRSVYQDGFTFDYTGHLLHISDPHFRTMIESLVGFENFNSIARRSYIYSQGTYTKYPYQINLYGLPLETIAECIEGYVLRNKTRKAPIMFKDWVQASFGKGFGKHFFYPYQQKIFATDINHLTADWTGRFVPSTSLTQIIQGALTEGQDPVGYNAHFYYPKQGGIVSWVEKIGQALKNPIYTTYEVTKIDSVNKVIYFSNGHVQPYRHLISTMPLDRLLTLVTEPAHRSYKKALNHLKCNSVINFNLGIAHPNISDKHWIYFPETKFPFYRLGFAHNFAQSMAPQGCSSLYGEFAHNGKSRQWVATTLKQSLQKTKELLSITDTDIVTEKIISISHAYVIYDMWRKKHLPDLLSSLADEHIHSVGRYGEWKYASMQEAVLDGKKIADQLVIMPATKSWLAPEPTIFPEKQDTTLT